MNHVFVSYKHSDLSFVQRLTFELEKADILVWSDVNIQVGEEWRVSIDDAIKKSYALIVAMTPEARLSEYVTYEWSYAMGLGIPVLTVLLEKTDLHPKLRPLQYLDYTDHFAAS
jgi:hypothetical protein